MTLKKQDIFFNNQNQIKKIVTITNKTKRKKKENEKKSTQMQRQSNNFVVKNGNRLNGMIVK